MDMKNMRATGSIGAVLAGLVGIMAAFLLLLAPAPAYAAGTNYDNAEQVSIGEWVTDSYSVTTNYTEVRRIFKFQTPSWNTEYTLSFEQLSLTGSHGTGANLGNSGGSCGVELKNANYNTDAYSMTYESTNWSMTTSWLLPNSVYYFVLTDYVSSTNQLPLYCSYRFKLEGNPVEMYRLYNPNSGEHFYTASTAERFNLIVAGWSDEGIGWTAPVSSNTPVFRMYNPNPSPTTGSGEHHYTTSEAERDSLVAAGWEYEGIGWYSDDSKSVPLYRVYNPNEFNNNHHYTTSTAERDNLLSLGWRDEGIAWYGV